MPEMPEMTEMTESKINKWELISKIHDMVFSYKSDISCSLNVKIKDDNPGILSIKFITSKESEIENFNKLLDQNKDLLIQYKDIINEGIQLSYEILKHEEYLQLNQNIGTYTIEETDEHYIKRIIYTNMKFRKLGSIIKISKKDQTF